MYERELKLGLVTYASYPEIIADSDELLQRMQEFMLDSVFEVLEIPYSNNPKVSRELRSMAASSCVDLIVSAGPNFALENWTLCSPCDHIRQQGIDRMKRVIDFSNSIGASQVVFMSGADDPPYREEMLTLLRQSIEILLGYAHKEQYLSLEPADREITHLQLLGPSTEVRDLLGDIPEEQFGITLDMSHIPQLNEELRYACMTLGAQVSHAHLANTVLADRQHLCYGDAHPRLGIVGSEFSYQDASMFVQHLQQYCFMQRVYYPLGLPVVSMEVKPMPDENNDLTLAGAKRDLFRSTRAL